jgi:hypothetical protein
MWQPSHQSNGSNVAAKIGSKMLEALCPLIGGKMSRAFAVVIK